MKTYIAIVAFALLGPLVALESVVLAQTAVATEAPAASASEFELPANEEGLPGAGALRRYDGYVNRWRQARSQWAKQVDADQHSVVFLGDSITQGWGEDFKGNFQGMKLANRGIGGDTTRGMLVRIEQDVLSLNPSAIVMLMGTNDIEVEISPETAASNVALILEAIKKHNANVPIVLCRTFPSSASKKRPLEKIKKLNELYDGLVKGDPQVTVVDTWMLYANEAGDADPRWFGDLLHLNADGYAKWAAALRPIFATLGFLETEPDDFELEPGFVSLFNGRDLTGWCFRPMPGAKKPDAKQPANPKKKPNPNAIKQVIVAEQVAFDGKKQSDDGRYVAINDRLVVTTPAEGRRIQQLWTTEEFGTDFVLRLEFRATPNADSGVFIRQPQLQCRDFPLAGPYKDLKNFRNSDWNELEVVVTGETARATCNGEVLEEAMKLPASGPIGLEGDRGQMEYRRIRIQKL